MKNCAIAKGMITYNALSYPLPEAIQIALKRDAENLRILREESEDRRLTLAQRKRAAKDYSEACDALDANEERLRSFSGVKVTRHVLNLVTPTP